MKNYTPAMMSLPRGYRNNNPLNIRKTPQIYKGEVEGTDKSFKTFSTMAYGFRAGFVILRTYFRKYKLNTVRKIISRWAPPVENDTDGYINFVCIKTGISPDETLFFNEELIPLVLAMAWQENGFPWNEQDAIAGWELI